MYGQLSTGYHDRGAPKKRFKDSLKKTLSTCNIDHHQRSTLAADRQAWRRTDHQVVSTFEDPHGANLRKNAAGGRSKEPQQLYQTKPLTAVAAARIACPVSA